MRHPERDVGLALLRDLPRAAGRHRARHQVLVVASTSDADRGPGQDGAMSQDRALDHRQATPLPAGTRQPDAGRCRHLDALPMDDLRHGRPELVCMRGRRASHATRGV